MDDTVALVAQSAVPTPSPSPSFDPDSVTPGPLGFFTILIVAVAALLLIGDMVRRVRRVRYRNEAAERRNPPEA